MNVNATALCAARGSHAKDIPMRQSFGIRCTFVILFLVTSLWGLLAHTSAPIVRAQETVRASQDAWLRAARSGARVSAPEASQTYLTFLPMTPRDSTGNDPSPPVPSPPGGGSDAGTLFVPSLSYAGKSRIVVDSSGGLHVVVEAVDQAFTGESGLPVQYSYCARNCETQASWSTVGIGATGRHRGGELRLALDAHDRPRVMWFYHDNLFSDKDNHYIYAACDARCTEASNWKRAQLPEDLFLGDSGEYFALDARGRPRFVYHDIESNHNGIFLAFCDFDCTVATNWGEGQITSSTNPGEYTLAYDAAGRLHFMFSVKASNHYVLIYARCDTECTLPENWPATVISQFRLGDTGHYVFKLNAQGQPRVALFSGYFSNDDPNTADDILYYGWCNADCLIPGSWQRYSLDLPETFGSTVDLELTSDGGPRIVFADHWDSSAIKPTASTMTYGWCNANCEAPGATWQTHVIEESRDVNASDPFPPNGACSDKWDFEGRPSLALDPSGNPRITYDVYGFENRLGPGCNLESLRLVRVALFPQPLR